MTKRFHAPILLLCVAVGVACDDHWTSPESPASVIPGLSPMAASVLASLTVYSPIDGGGVVMPGDSLQLTTLAWNDRGERMAFAGAPTYSSRTPSIARVDSSGVVTAGARGTAEITASLTLGGITRTGNTTVRVYPGADSMLAIAGVYDLTMVIMASDPIWGIKAGTRQLAVMTVRDNPRQLPIFTGTFVFAPDSEFPAETDGVRGTVGLDGLVVLELFSDTTKVSDVRQIGFWIGRGSMTSGQMEGTYSCCVHIGGTFTAVRRKTQ